MTDETVQQDLLYFNGINGDDGNYEIPPISPITLKQIISGEAKPENLAELKGWSENRRIAGTAMGVVEGVDPNKLDESGWGVILPNDIDPQIVEALSPLLNHRQGQAGRFFYKFEGARGYYPGKNKQDFLKENRAGPGPANPEKIPYYLLLVGSPDKIPYSFQVQMDVQYSVGRIYFDTVEEYANYARSVVAAETGKVRLKRQAAFFGTANADDRATQLSATCLVQEMLNNASAQYQDWTFTPYLAEKATKAQLADLLGGRPAETPALLFSASHGMGFDSGSQRQAEHQGALLCQDWPGPQEWRKAIPQDFYFAGDDLLQDRNLLGMVAFLFACYGAGTPQMDQFSKHYFRDRKPIAPNAFLARLPIKMLGLPGGGALAVVGHIERAWGYSFKWLNKGTQTETFDSTLGAMLSGKTVGNALEYFNNRYAELSTDLSMRQENMEANGDEDPYELATIWTANNDARGYAILGDPAVRMPVVEAGQEAIERLAVQPVEINSSSLAASENGGQPKSQPAENPGQPKDATVVDYTPPPVPLDELSKYPALEKVWIKNMQAGYQNTEQIARSIRTAFLISHYSTLAMYWLIFAAGIGVFIAGLRFDSIWVAVAGAVGMAAFVVFFIARSVHSVEQNLLYITWMGLIYNSYWVHQLWAMDPQTSQQVLDKATQDAIRQIRDLVDRYEISYKTREKLKAKVEQAAAGAGGNQP